jgi:fructose-bisphosphate aldolase, class I
MNKDELERIAKSLVGPGKGILAADESTGTIEKRFSKIGLESTPENHRLYRQLLFTTPGIEEFISGVIMFDETIRQSDDSETAFSKLLSDRGIIPGIKVDKGTVDLANFPGEKITQGIDELSEHLLEYKKLGAMFAKWRAVITIGEEIPTDACIESNAELLARYAVICQNADIVPIVEPEVLMDGTHNFKKSEIVTYQTLKKVFNKLSQHKVYFPGMLLKPNWVHPGKESGEKVSDKEIAEISIKVYTETVLPEVPGIVFLSGGDSPQESTGHLNAMNMMGNQPWQLSFSFGRALQEPVLDAWKGKSENVKLAQDAFYKRAKLNSLAREGKYDKEMEEEV